jgi:hypothetical protein
MVTKLYNCGGVTEPLCLFFDIQKAAKVSDAASVSFLRYKDRYQIISVIQKGLIQVFGIGDQFFSGNKYKYKSF